MKQLRVRILSFFSLALILFSILFMYLSFNILERQAIEQQSNDLEAQLKTLSSQLDTTALSEEGIALLIPSLDRTAAVVSERITFISLDGEVLYDTRAEQERLENHFDRPEIQQLIQGESVGSFSRRSSSTGEVLYYVATSIFDSEGDVLGFLRLSKNVDEMADATDRMVEILAIFMIISIILALLFTQYWTKRISRPIEDMKQVTEQLSKKHYSTRYESDSYKEIDDLGYSINHLAVSLENQMNELEQNDNKLKELINHLVIGVMVVNNERYIEMVNPVMNEILNEDLYGSIGKQYNNAIHSAGLVELIEKAYSKKEIQNQEMTIYYPEEKIVDVNVVPILTSANIPVNFIVLLYDITEIRRLEKIRRDFVANVSHELRTPITAVKGFSETLLDGAMYDKEVMVEFLNIIHKESTRLDTMVQDILQLSKLEQRQVTGTIERVIVNEVIEDIQKILHQKIELKSIDFQIFNSDNLELLMDRDQLKQILLNLVANALAYTQEGGIVKILATNDGEQGLLIVEDNGIGIPSEKQSRVFERFYRVDKARSRNAGGTGLGLSIVKWLVENNNGRIQLDSQEGRGSAFKVWLPLYQ